MIKFIIGGKGQGKLQYVLEKEKYNKEDVCFGEECQYEEVFKKPILYNFHLLVKRLLKDKIDPIEFTEDILARHENIIIISDEIGLGIVPMDKEDRNWREVTGRACCIIAKKAALVERVLCGIPMTIKEKKEYEQEAIKDSRFLKVIMIRHGRTEGNELKRYIGKTDEHLTLGGIHQLLNRASENFYPMAEKAYVSPMLRCIETAKIIYPKAERIIDDGLKETDFGDFENKSYEDLKDEPAYQKWIDGNGQGACPNGEEKSVFIERCQRSFEEIINNSLGEESIAFVVHGGTIMAILDKYAKPHKDFYNWQLKNGDAYVLSIDKNKWINEKEVIVKDKLDEKCDDK